MKTRATQGMCTTMPALVLVLAAAMTSAQVPAQAQSVVSEASALSLLPVAVSVAVPAGLVLSAGVSLTVAAVEVSAAGTVWVLERVSDGARLSVRFAGKLVEGAALSTGAVIIVSAVASGTVLSAAGRAIAFIPNEIGASLLHNEKITR